MTSKKRRGRETRAPRPSEPATPTPRPSSDSAPGGASRLGIGVLVAALPFIAAAIRLWLYASGDESVFLVLLSSTDIPSLLIGTAATLAPSLLVALPVFVVSDARFRKWLGTTLGKHRAVPGVLLTVIVIAVFTANEWTVVLYLIVAGSSLLAWKARSTRVGRYLVPSLGEPHPDTTATVLVIALFAMSSASSGWLPREQVGLSGGEEVDASVIESTGEWTSLLVGSEICIYRTDAVFTRSIPETGGRWSLLAAVHGAGWPTWHLGLTSGDSSEGCPPATPIRAARGR
jgi:hypothetical protein